MIAEYFVELRNIDHETGRVKKRASQPNEIGLPVKMKFPRNKHSYWKMPSFTVEIGIRVEGMLRQGYFLFLLGQLGLSFGLENIFGEIPDSQIDIFELGLVLSNFGFYSIELSDSLFVTVLINKLGSLMLQAVGS